MPVVVCPGCRARTQVAEGTRGRFRCVTCGQIISIGLASSEAPGSSTVAPRRPGENPLDGLPESQPPVGHKPMMIPPRTPHFSRGSVAGSHPKAASIWDPAFKRFLKRLGLALVALTIGLLLLMGIGFISEPLAFVVMGVALLATLGLAFGGRIWLLVTAFQESATQGLLVLFVPYYWLFYLAKHKQQCARPLSVFGSALVPAMILLLMVTLFEPRYNRRSTGPPPIARQWQTPAVTSQPGEPYAPVPPPMPAPTPVMAAIESDTVQTVSFPVIQVQNTNAQAEAESLLNSQPGYVAGSFRLSDDGQSVTFQYRGARTSAMRYVILLPVHAGIMLRMAPTFAD